MSPQSRFIDPAIQLSTWEKWNAGVIAQIVIYFCLCIIGLNFIPNTIWNTDGSELVYVMGAIGVWRYGWWLNHWVRP